MLQSYIDDFILEQRSRGNSSQTVQYYISCLYRFSVYIGDDFDLKNLTPKLLKQYVVHLSASELSSVSVQSYCRGLRSFLSWLYSQGFISVDLCNNFSLPKASRKVIDVLTDEEISRIFLSLDSSDWLCIRNSLIVSLMLDSGLRLNEVVTLRRDQINLKDKYLVVTGKGDKQRIVPFGKFTFNILERYLAAISSSGDQEYLLIKMSETLCGFEPITQATVKNMFRRLRVRSNVPRLYPHLLRHTFATRYLENGGNIYSLQAILGHSSLEMVKKYLHLATSRIRADFPKFSPLDNIKKDPPDGES